ncbi:hypothetical protein BGZ68_002540, partial [Mortierella alpina]
MKTRPLVEAALIRNLRHIRTIGCFPIYVELLQLLAHGLPEKKDDFFEDPGTLCTNLRRIDLDSFCSKDFYFYAQQVDRLLRHNHRLTHLVVCFEILLYENAYSTISTLRHLQHFTVNCLEDYAQTDQICGLLRACLPLPELTELDFVETDILWDDLDSDTTEGTALLGTVLREATIARFAHNPAAKRIKSMRFPGTVGWAWVPLPLLLLKSDLLDLETCYVPSFSEDMDVDELELVVREHCPNLKHLSCRFLRTPAEVEVVRAFIRGCSGLQSFTSSNFHDEIGHEERQLLLELVTRHHTTLEVFEVDVTDQRFSRNLQKVLSQCKQLKRFGVISDRKTTRSAIVAMDIYGSDWVCLELRELGLVLNLRPNDKAFFADMDLKKVEEWVAVDDETEEQVITIRSKYGEVVEWDKDESDSYRPLVALATKRVYNQIGRLEKLEELTLGIDRSDKTWQLPSDYEFNLTLCKGWLGEMAGMKNLRRLRLEADFWSAMGQAEVEFMHKHWPLLREITFPCDIAQIHAMSHWQWLLSQRPHLCYLSTHPAVAVKPGWEDDPS